MKYITLVFLFCAAFLRSNTQPYLDLIGVKYLRSSGTVGSGDLRERYSITYHNTGINLPLAFKPVRGIVLFSPLFEQWNITRPVLTSEPSRYQNFVLPVSIIDTFSAHRWRYVITPIIRMKNLIPPAEEPVQFGIAGLLIYSPSTALTWKFGVYFNKDYSGNIFMPLVGIDWRINDRNFLFGILPGNIVWEHQVNKRFYYGAGFKAISNSYLNLDRSYLRINDNQVGGFCDLYPAKQLVFNTEIGYSFSRKLTNGLEKKAGSQNPGMHNGVYVRLALAYRIRFGR